MKNKRSYRQGMVLTKNHPSLEYGQIVDIISEDEFYYTVQFFQSAGLEKIEKKDLQTN